MNDYDQAARFAAKRLDPLGFFLWLLGAAFGRAWDWHRWLDTQNVPFPGEADRRCDTVAAFTRHDNDGPPLAVVVEFMSESRRAILERLVGYELNVRFDIPYQEAEPKVQYDVIGVVVNLTGTRLEGRWSMAPRDCGGVGLWSKAQVRNLEAMNARTVLSGIAADKIARCVLVWVPLMKGGAAPENLARWKRLAEREADAEKRTLYGALALVFAELAERKAIWQRNLEGWNVLRSPLLREWEANGERRMARRNLLTVLEERFPQRIPPALVQTVEAQEDVALLERWLRAAVRVSSPEALSAEIAANGH